MLAELPLSYFLHKFGTKQLMTAKHNIAITLTQDRQTDRQTDLPKQIAVIEGCFRRLKIQGL